MSKLKFILFISILFLLLGCLLLGCKKKGKVVIECGGGAQFACPAHSYCSFDKDCGGVDHKGICKRIPHDCLHEKDPSKKNLVCGCNHKTYSSECIANASHISVAHEGECIESDY